MLKHGDTMSNEDQNKTESNSDRSNMHGVAVLAQSGVVVSESALKGSRKRKFLWAGLLLVFVAVVGISNYIYIARRSEPKKVIQETTQERLDRAAAENDKANRALLSKPLAAGATEAEKEYYYTTGLRLKMQDANSQAVAEYYLTAVRPANVTLPLDLREQLVQPLIASGHVAEAKELLMAIVAEYKATPASDPALQPYIDTKINQYIKMEQAL